MILNSTEHKKCYFDLLEFCDLAEIDIQVLFLYTQIKKYCLNPPCMDEYKDIFMNASPEIMMKKAIEIKQNKEHYFYPYGESMLDEIFEAFIED